MNYVEYLYIHAQGRFIIARQFPKLFIVVKIVEIR